MTDRHWFEPLARFLGPAYLKNAFTMGTEQEVEFLVAELALAKGARVLDVGCGPGRHALALARRGFQVTGVDISEAFVALARSAAGDESVGGRAQFMVGDVRELDVIGGYDLVLSLCQGGFGLLGGPASDDPLGADLDVIRRMASSLRTGGRLVLSAFSSLFAVRFLEAGDRFDAATGVNHEVATLRDASGAEQPFDLWTTCFTVRELRLLAAAADLTVDAVYGVTPGKYQTLPPDLEQPELLLVARK